MAGTIDSSKRILVFRRSPATCSRSASGSQRWHQNLNKMGDRVQATCYNFFGNTTSAVTGYWDGRRALSAPIRDRSLNLTQAFRLICTPSTVRTNWPDPLFPDAEPSCFTLSPDTNSTMITTLLVSVVLVFLALAGSIPRPRRLRLCFVLLLFGFFVPSARGAETELSVLREKALQLRLDLTQLETELRVLTKEQRLLKEVRPDNPPSEQPLPQPAPRGIAEILNQPNSDLQKSGKERNQALQALLNEQDKELQAVELHWKEATLASLNFPDQIAKAEAHIGIRWNRDPDAEWTLGEDPTTAKLMFLAWIVLVVSFTVTTIILRRAFRKRLRTVSSLRGLVIILCFLGGFAGILWTGYSLGQATFQEKSTLLSFDSVNVAQNRALARVQSEIAQNEKKVQKLRKQQQVQKQQVLEERDRIIAHWDELAPNASPALRESLLAHEKAGYDLYHQLLIQAELVPTLREQSLLLADQVRANSEQLSTFLGQSDFLHTHEWIRIGTIAATLLFVLIPLVFGWLIRRNQEDSSQNCPCCFASGDSWQEVDDLAGRPDTFADVKYLRCTECGFRLPASEQHLPLISIPTLGVYSSGKTHCLMEVYAKLKANSLPARCTFLGLPSEQEDDIRGYLKALHEPEDGKRAGPEGTHNDLPAPLLYRVTDQDPFGQNEFLLSLFDFSGETTRAGVIESALARRALLMDAILFFLDPTVSIDEQLDALQKILQGLRALEDNRKISSSKRKVNQTLEVPVAVCVTKIDLLTDQKVRGWIRELRKSFASGKTDLAQMKHRSAMTEKALQFVFPGANVTGLLRQHFKGRFLFFPLTPVSLVEKELGVTDMSARTFAPVGILDPILWLLHVQGSSVL